MSISGINVKYLSSISSVCVDEEEKRIASRLVDYGITPTGNKSADRAKLREIEVNEAMNINYVTNRFITLSTQEQEKIQLRKKEINRYETVEKIQYTENFNGAKALGEQVFIAINLKRKNNN